MYLFAKQLNTMLFIITHHYKTTQRNEVGYAWHSDKANGGKSTSICICWPSLPANLPSLVSTTLKFVSVAGNDSSHFTTSSLQ